MPRVVKQADAGQLERREIRDWATFHFRKFISLKKLPGAYEGLIRGQRRRGTARGPEGASTVEMRRKGGGARRMLGARKDWTTQEKRPPF